MSVVKISSASFGGKICMAGEGGWPSLVKIDRG